MSFALQVKVTMMEYFMGVFKARYCLWFSVTL